MPRIERIWDWLSRGWLELLQGSNLHRASRPAVRPFPGAATAMTGRGHRQIQVMPA